MSTRETLRTTLLNLLEEEMGESVQLPEDDQDLRESLGLDSVDLVGLVMRIEHQFKVRLATEELAAVKRVGDLLDLMEVKLAARRTLRRVRALPRSRTEILDRDHGAPNVRGKKCNRLTAPGTTGRYHCTGSPSSMLAGRSGTIQRQIQTLFTTGTVGSLADGQLLERFANHHDEAAFEALVERHGPMVLRVCRGVLADLNDADDAFQATFLILVRRAGSIRKRDSLASWLFGVAGRVAARRRVDAARRWKNEQAAARLELCSASDRDAPDPGLVLHEELAATTGEVPRSGRPLLPGGAELRGGGATAETARGDDQSDAVPGARIVARPSGAAWGCAAGRVGGRETQSGRRPLSVPPALVQMTVEAVARSTSAVGASAQRRRLTRGVLRSMLLSRLKFVAVAVLAGVAVAGSAVLARSTISPPRPPRLRRGPLTTGRQRGSRDGSSTSKASRSPARRLASHTSSRPPTATSMPGSTRSSGWPSNRLDFRLSGGRARTRRPRPPPAATAVSRSTRCPATQSPRRRSADRGSRRRKCTS